MLPQYSAVILYILIAILCCYSKANSHCLYALCAIAIANHILIIAIYPKTNQAAIATLLVAVFAISNYILTNKKNKTLYALTLVVIYFIATSPAPAPNINLHIIMSSMLGAVTILASMQSYCIFVQNRRLKQASTPEENLLPLTMLGSHLKNTAIAGLALTTFIAIRGFYNISSYDNITTTKMILTLIIWLLFAVLVMKKNILKISLIEKSFLMILSALLLIATCSFCMYLG